MNKIDFSLLFAPLLLVFVSLATFYSIDRVIFRQQLIFFFIAIIFYFIFLNIDYRIFGYYSKQIYVLMVFFLLVILLVGTESKGAVRWIEFFGVRVQFSEIFKPFFVIFFSAFLSFGESRSFSKFLTAFLLLLPVFFLTVKQPDLGNAIIFLFTLVFMLFSYGFSFTNFLIVGVPFFASLPILFKFLHSYQKNRILTFLSISQDPLGSSYNAIQSVISVGSGGIFGKGLGQATQSVLKFLPERHTDFIFATVSESLGFIGALFLLLLYFIFLYRIFQILKNVRTGFPRLILTGYFFLFLSHIFFNIGMNIGLIPIVGITLPFISYGGSSLVTNFIILGIMSSVGFESRKGESIEIR